MADVDEERDEHLISSESSSDDNSHMTDDSTPPTSSTSESDEEYGSVDKEFTDEKTTQTEENLSKRYDDLMIKYQEVLAKINENQKILPGTSNGGSAAIKDDSNPENSSNEDELANTLNIVGIANYQDNEGSSSNNETVVDIPPTPTAQPLEHLENMIKKRLISLDRASTFSHAMMNVALFSANANQLKNLVEKSEESSTIFNKLSFCLIIVSLVFQCILKVCSIFGSCCGYANPEKSLKKAEVLKYAIVFITVIITLVNLSVTSFVFLEDILEFL